MPALEPLIAGKWSGHNLWIQWTPDETAAEGYKVEISVRAKPDDKVKWTLIDTGHTMRAWMVIPIWREGAIIQARVSVAGREGEPEMAKECAFVRSSCLFNFQASSRRALDYKAKSNFHCVVDGAGCSYFTDLDIYVPAGETQPATLQALCSSGWNQLDKEGDFDLHPQPEVRIWNAEPSHNDVRPTGRDFTVLEVGQRDGPVAVVFAPHNPNVR